MSVLYILILISVILAACAGFAFRWAVLAGQYDNLDQASHRMIHEDLDKQ